MASEDNTVEVVYATPEVQRVVRVPFTPGLTAVEAVRRAGVLEEFPEIQASPLVLGVFGARVEEDTPLAPGERVEICRPLKQDPRAMRWSVAADGGVMGSPRRGEDE
ncbi:MAG: RnfH family protein [Gammaproteobacteria bacterium]